MNLIETSALDNDSALATESETLAPKINRKKVIAQFKSGEIRLEQGADGLYLLFDCDCLDAIPFCQAQCCGLKGIGVQPEEEDRLESFIEWDAIHGFPAMKRDADAFCVCLDRDTRRCQIYDNRPQTCRQFHCTRGATSRGWKIPNSVKLQAFD